MGPPARRAWAIPGVQRCAERSEELRGELPAGFAIAIEKPRDFAAVLPEFVRELCVRPAAPPHLSPDQWQRGGGPTPEFCPSTSDIHPRCVLSTDSAVNRHVYPGLADRLPFDSMNASTPGEGSTLGQRLEYAFQLETKTQTAIESALMVRHADLFPHRGFLSSYKSGRRGGKTPDAAKIKAIADFLHVQFEWLLLGSGPVRRGGRGETPAETAMIFARTIGVREDAWEVAWERNKDRADSMTVEDWFNTIKAEAEKLNHAGIPRPEEDAARRDKQGKIRRTAKKKYDAKKEAPTLLVAETKRHAYGGSR